MTRLVIYLYSTPIKDHKRFHAWVQSRYSHIRELSRILIHNIFISLWPYSILLLVSWKTQCNILSSGISDFQNYKTEWNTVLTYYFSTLSSWKITINIDYIFDRLVFAKIILFYHFILICYLGYFYVTAICEKNQFENRVSVS